MKNREKYRDEIVGYPGRDLCDFKINEVFPKLGKKGCSGMSCAWCSSLFSLWLDGEYEEPPKPEVDWDNVPVDTLVRVKDFAADVGVLRYFKGIDDSNPVGRFVAWAGGKTSVTANGSCTKWAFCELVEDEDD